MAQASAFLVMVAPYALIILAFYFFLIRPQQKREKETQNMRGSVKEGDEIVTIGGIYGKVLNVGKEDILTLEVGADKVKIKIARWAIGKKITKDEK